MSSEDEPDTGLPSWTFLTNHARVLICIAADPHNRIRDIAHCTGITERATQQVITDLEESGYITRHRVGRRNTYTLNPDQNLHHPDDTTITVGALIDLFAHTHHRRPKSRRTIAASMRLRRRGTPPPAT